MSASNPLVRELQGQLKVAAADLRARSEEPGLPWAEALRGQYDAALAAGRTGLSWSEWRDGEVEQAAVAWVLATVFVRFCEDNGLLDGVLIAGEGQRQAMAVDAESAFYSASPERNARDWLREGFRTLAATPAGRGLLDPAHSPVWSAPLSADACSGLLRFWREQDAGGALLRSLADPQWSTRFLGDIYQDLSEAAQKKYALLQTPVFVEEFILDQTLTPALAEFGLEGLRLIDPTCGSGHFLLGAFDRLLAEWNTTAPGLDERERVQRALDHVHGVDLNPFAVAIARFRLTVAAMRAAGIARLQDAPAFRYHLAVGDSLLAGFAGIQGDLLDDSDGAAAFAYAAEDVGEHPGILDRGRYHVVVGNPPYITVSDPALNEAYRKSYLTCHREYALSVPFMELFFSLAIRADAGTPAGYVGQITSNSFMKREFGVKLIQSLLSGVDPLNPVDLTEVIDTSGAYIPGHGTPTVVLIGRRRRPVKSDLRVVLGRRGEPKAPADASKGKVWTEIVENVDRPGFEGAYVSVHDWPRSRLRFAPWILSAGGYDAVERMGWTPGSTSVRPLSVTSELIGYTGQTNADDVFLAPDEAFARTGVESETHRQVVIGEVIRDFDIGRSDHALFLYDAQELLPIDRFPGAFQRTWPYRTVTWARATFAKTTYRQEGRSWWEWHQVSLDRLRTPLSLAFAFVATHNHFVLDRGGKVFNRSAPVIKLPAEATEDDYLGLLGVLNSSTACFWLKQVSHNKGNGGIGGGIGDEDWEPRYEFTGTKLEEFPLPSVLPLSRARHLDQLAQRVAMSAAASVAREGRVAASELAASRTAWLDRRRQMIYEQEELDWEVYRLYGLIDTDLTSGGHGIEQISLGERAFEIALARQVAAGEEETAWFERHGSTPITELPADWPDDYKALVQRRLDLIENDPLINLLERPEYKRRWASRSWEEMEREALTDFVLDRLEAAELWSDGQGPRVLSVAALADLVRKDEQMLEALRTLTGDRDVDVTKALAPLVREEAVPFLAAHRYKPSGLAKRADWEKVWDLQRREDRDWDGGKPQPIPVPPKYGPTDFAKVPYWRARGKLDVPKERFIVYPDAGREGDSTDVLGWAGWDHAEQARALARLLVDRGSEGYPVERLVPLMAGLAELEPWLEQWHSEMDPAFGASPAQAIRGLLEQNLTLHGLTRADLAAWRPQATARGRKAAT